MSYRSNVIGHQLQCPPTSAAFAEGRRTVAEAIGKGGSFKAAARLLRVSYSTVILWAKKLGLGSPMGYGGAREGAGRPPKKARKRRRPKPAKVADRL